MERKQTVGNEKIASLFDAGTFVEIGAYVKRPGDSSAYDGIICGYGAISGKPAFAFVQDGDRLKGALDMTGAQKICMTYELAIKTGAPVIGVFDSAGVSVSDGSAALSAYGKVISCVASASGIVPQIAILDGLCTGLSLTVAGMFDLVITVSSKAVTYINKENDGTAPDAAYVAENEDEAFAMSRKLVSVLPLNNCDSAANVVSDEPGRAVNISAATGKALVEEIADNNDYTELWADIANEVTTGLCYFGGELCGVVASNNSQNGGKLTCKGAKKAAGFVAFCDRFNIDVVTLVDSEGFGKAGCSSAFSALASAYSNAKCGKVSVVVGKAYGAAFTLLGSKAVGADIEYALENSLISVMSPESAVAFLCNDEITSDKPRAQVEKEWIEKNATAVSAAEKGDVDDVIPAEELRARICSAVYMFATKTDDVPDRRSFRLIL